MGETLIGTIKKSQSANPDLASAVKWVDIKSGKKGTAGLNRQEYYAVPVIPQDFSQKQASLLAANPEPPHVKIYINQGMNASASAMAGQMLNQVVDGINNKLRADFIAAFDRQSGTITTKQASMLAAPVIKEIINVNETGTHSANGNAPVSLFQPIWMGSLLGGLIFYMAGRKLTFAGGSGMFAARASQICFGAVLALLAGFGLTWFSESWGLHIPSFADTALFLALCYFTFFLMISPSESCHACTHRNRCRQPYRAAGIVS